MSVATNISSPRQSFLQWISNHGFETFLIVYGVWVFTPFFAPLFMHLGWTGAGKSIYFVYSFFCHQLPERSFFFFGEKSTYTLGEIQASWQNTANPMVLRQFIGNTGMGWKAAWSDRMISFYTSVWFFAVLWYPLRRTIRALPWWGLFVLLAPILLDGVTHALSDLSGIGQGFRDTNIWLVALTDNRFPGNFYAGDVMGSFNSIARLITGILAGLGIVWFAFSYFFRETS